MESLPRDRWLSSPCFAGSCDWFLPTSDQLGGPFDCNRSTGLCTATGGIVDMTATGCDSGSPCIASIPGPTSAGWSWTSTTGTTGVVDEYYVNIVNFYDGAARAPAERASPAWEPFARDREPDRRAPATPLSCSARY